MTALPKSSVKDKTLAIDKDVLFVLFYFLIEQHMEDNKEGRNLVRRPQNFVTSHLS